jgi:rSAM/selenodomain-associated transferase 2
MSISIVIPTLNEASSLEHTLKLLTALSPLPLEIIIVDGGSSDETIAIATQFATTSPVAVKVLTCEAQGHSKAARCGRSVQMNQGAKAANGDIVCFLHADTQIPGDAIAVIENTLKDSTIALGGFISIMCGTHTTRWGISLHNFLKTYYAPLLFRPHLFVHGLRLLFGDQVMFCRRSDFWDCDGFNEALPIMEDGDLCLRLIKKGRIQQINRIVQSSDRRVACWGAWKATAIYLYIGILWGVGVSTTYLKQFYEDIR